MSLFIRKDLILQTQLYLVALSMKVAIATFIKTAPDTT